MGPNPNAVYPNEAIKQVVYIKNVIMLRWNAGSAALTRWTPTSL